MKGFRSSVVTICWILGLVLLLCGFTPALEATAVIASGNVYEAALTAGSTATAQSYLAFYITLGVEGLLVLALAALWAMDARNKKAALTVSAPDGDGLQLWEAPIAPKKPVFTLGKRAARRDSRGPMPASCCGSRHCPMDGE